MFVDKYLCRYDLPYIPTVPTISAKRGEIAFETKWKKKCSSIKKMHLLHYTYICTYLNHFTDLCTTQTCYFL